MITSPVLLLAEGLMGIFLVLGAHALRRKFSLGYLYATQAFILVLIWALPQDLAVQVGSLRFLIPSSILFSTLLLGAFVSYIFDGPRAGRVSIGVIMGGTVIFPLMSQLLRFHGQMIDPGAAPLFHVFNPREYLASVVAVFADLVFLTVVWELLNRLQNRLPMFLRVFLALLSVMWLDVVVYISLVFAGSPAYLPIIEGNLITRFILALIMSPVLSAYMLWEIRHHGLTLGSRPVLAIFLEENLAKELQAAQNNVVKGQVALKESEDRYRATVDDLPLMICRFLPDGQLTYANNAFCRYFAVDPEELSRKVFEGIVMEGARVQLGRFLKNLSPGEPTGSIELEVLPSTGGTGCNRWSLRALFDADNRLVALLGIGEDVTRERLLEQQLRQSQKLEAIGRLAGGVAHDFNNILTAILGNDELSLGALETEPPDLALAREGLLEIDVATQRASALTRQLLIFSRKDVGHPSEMNLNDVLVDLKKMLQRIIGGNITLELDCAADLDLVVADRVQLEQVVMNLVINAGDSMPQGGRVLLKTKNMNLKPDDLQGDPDAKPGLYVQLEVTDTGVGMSEEDLGRIFEPFFTTKDPEKGTGLGLSTTFGIVKRAGGLIRVVSKPDSGSTFRVLWPAHQGGSIPDVRTQNDLRQKSEPGNSATVLACDDDSAILNLLVKHLRRAGYQVLGAGSGAEAIEKAVDSGLDLAILVTDVMMPGMNGRELAEQLTRRIPTLKTIFLSGYSGEVLARQGILEGEVNFLAKPFTRSDLLSKVAQVLEG